ncbi:MAG: hypothetical protein CMH55_07610 [Myxococcales bacterium]|nr:hypothetical protein [Myxococcales bacterium]
MPTETSWTSPKPISDAMMAFPASVCGEYLPPMDEIPERFHRFSDPYVELVRRLFFEGGSVAEWKAREGVDRDLAIKNLRAVLGSYEPKHEHKEAGAAYLVSLWFKVPGIEAPSDA